MSYSLCIAGVLQQEIHMPPQSVDRAQPVVQCHVGCRSHDVNHRPEVGPGETAPIPLLRQGLPLWWSTNPYIIIIIQVGSHLPLVLGKVSTERATLSQATHITYMYVSERMYLPAGQSQRQVQLFCNCSTVSLKKRRVDSTVSLQFILMLSAHVGMHGLNSFRVCRARDKPTSSSLRELSWYTIEHLFTDSCQLSLSFLRTVKLWHILIHQHVHTNINLIISYLYAS